MTTIGDVLVEYKELPERGAKPPVLTLTEKNGFVLQADRFHKRLATEDTSKYKVVHRLDIAFNPYLLWAGAVAQNTIVDEGVISPLYPTFKVRDGFDPVYVTRLLLSPEMVSAYDGIAFGSVPRRRRSSVPDFLGLQIPTPPPLDEQHRIAAILDHADALRTKRRQAISHLDDLAQSIFLDMFGDPDDYAKTGDTTPFASVADLQGGRNLVADDSEIESPYRVLKISAVTSGQFKPVESKPLPLDYQPPPEHLVRSGDLLISRANTTELVGAVAFVRDVAANLALPDKIWRFVWRDPHSVPLFYWSLFRTPSIRRRMSQLSSGTGGSMKNISKAKLGQLEIPLITTDQQRKFAHRITAVPAASGDEFDDLFTSLQSRAFTGQL
ncbi:hypothetical protein [Mycobacteroides abscessus]|uniref:hypothetical protein n=1 Tax=Mycobacteroides abscessus TaxID=36809 RepID=UPI001B7D8CC3